MFLNKSIRIKCESNTTDFRIRNEIISLNRIIQIYVLLLNLLLLHFAHTHTFSHPFIPNAIASNRRNKKGKKKTKNEI